MSRSANLRTTARKPREPKSDLLTLPSIGPAMVRDLNALGVRSVAALARRNPERLYEALCETTGVRHDPCVRYTFRCAVYCARTPESLREAALTQWWNWKDRALDARESKVPSAPPLIADNADALTTLRGLGMRSAAMLAQAGITRASQLRALGAARAYMQFVGATSLRNLNMLWALEGAITNRDWREVARCERLRLFNELDALGFRV